MCVPTCEHSCACVYRCVLGMGVEGGGERLGERERESPGMCVVKIFTFLRKVVKFVTFLRQLVVGGRDIDVYAFHIECTCDDR